MSSIEDLFNRIESPRFTAIVNLASGYRAFERILDAQPETKELLGLAPSQSDAIKHRVDYCVRKEAEPDLEHPFDSALAAYLTILGKSKSPYARIAAETVIRQPGTWWSRKLAEQLLVVNSPGVTQPIASDLDFASGRSASAGSNSHEVLK